MLIVFIRAIILYLLLVVAMRLMGKRQIGQLQPFEFAITLVVAEVACIPMSETSIPLAYGIIPIFTLFVAHLIFTKLSKNSIHFRKFLNGKPVIVINPNGIDCSALNKLDFSVNDLMEALRGANYFSPSEVRYAIYETNGQLTVIPKSANKPVTIGDMNIAPNESDIPYMLVCEKKVMHDNLQKSGVDENKLTQILQKHDLKPKDILLLSVCGKEEIYIQPYRKQAIYDTMEAIEA